MFGSTVLRVNDNEWRLRDVCVMCGMVIRATDEKVYRARLGFSPTMPVKGIRKRSFLVLYTPLRSLPRDYPWVVSVHPAGSCLDLFRVHGRDCPRRVIAKIVLAVYTPGFVISENTTIPSLRHPSPDSQDNLPDSWAHHWRPGHFEFRGNAPSPHKA